MRVTVLAGGVGSARFLAGLVRVVDPAELTVVVNTGDDERIRGLHVSPDIDTVLYHLAALSDWDRGWGLTGETFVADERYRTLAQAAGAAVDLQEWFALGDRDLATHLLRARILDTGGTLTEATDALRRAMGIACTVLPMSDDPVRTRLRTSSGDLLDFQDYFVRLRQRAEITQIVIDAAAGAGPAPGVLDAVADADVLLVPPSNPLLSIEPVLETGGIRAAVAGAKGTRVAVSPIVGGKALKGPADLLMRALGHDVSPVGVARLYQGLVDVFVCDEQDRDRLPEIVSLGMRAAAADTIMRSAEDAARVAKAVLDLAH